ncbi:MAG TPA: ribokinase [Bacillaceae bacterium]
MKDSPAVVIIGSLNMDMVLQSSKHPEEGETILGDHFFSCVGGKGANQAVAAARLGAEVTLVGAVGDDIFGQQLIDKLQVEGIHTEFITKVDGHPTGIACVQVSQKDNRITVIPGANHQLKPEHIDQAENIIKAAKVILLQMEIPLKTVTYAIKKAKQWGKKVILNPAPAAQLPEDLFREVDYFTPNETELRILAPNSPKEGSIDAFAKELLGTGMTNLIVTLGEKGAAYFSAAGEKKEYNPHPVETIDTTGAGDAFNGALACALARGATVEKAIDFGMKAGAMSVTKLGAQAGMPTQQEMDSFFLNSL